MTLLRVTFVIVASTVEVTGRFHARGGWGYRFGGMRCPAPVWAAALAVAAIAAAALPSGARPGTPAQPPASSFSARVDNPWFPLKPGHDVRLPRREGRQARARRRSRSRTATRRSTASPASSSRTGSTSTGGSRSARPTGTAQDARGQRLVLRRGHRRARRARPRNEHRGHAGGRAWTARRPGIFMPAHPRVGQSGQQEFFKGHAEDHFQVLSLHAAVARAVRRRRRSALLTKEWTPLEPGVVDHKLYVRGVGTVLEETVGRRRAPRARLVPSRVMDCSGMSETELYDLRVTVERIEGRSVCGLAGRRLLRAHRVEPRCGSPRASTSASTRCSPSCRCSPRSSGSSPDGDWLEQDTLVACPDPDERMIMRIERIGRRTMRDRRPHVSGARARARPADRQAARRVRGARAARRGGGFDVVTVFNDLFFQPALPALLEIAQATERVRVGPSCLNPFTLHPVEIAGQVAALDLASRGRAFLGLAAGAWLDALGLDTRAPARPRSARHGRSSAGCSLARRLRVRRRPLPARRRADGSRTSRAAAACRCSSARGRRA